MRRFVPLSPSQYNESKGNLICGAKKVYNEKELTLSPTIGDKSNSKYWICPPLWPVSCCHCHCIEPGPRRSAAMTGGTRVSLWSSVTLNGKKISVRAGHPFNQLYVTVKPLMRPEDITVGASVEATAAQVGFLDKDFLGYWNWDMTFACLTTKTFKKSNNNWNTSVHAVFVS